MFSEPATGHTILHHPVMNAVTFIKNKHFFLCEQLALHGQSIIRRTFESPNVLQEFLWTFPPYLGHVSKQPPIGNYWIDSFKSLCGHVMLS